MSRRALRALVDESQTPNRRVYLMTAAVVDHRSADFNRLMNDLEGFAATLPSGEIHASRMQPDEIEDAEQVVRSSSAVKYLTTVRAPVTDGLEQARQRCLADLAVRLVSRHSVGEMIMDTRRRSINGRADTSADAKDLANIKSLMGDGRLPRDLKIRHASDAQMHQLWLPDLAAYAVQQSLARTDPDRLVRLADKMEIAEATILPIDQRTPGGPHRVPATALNARTAELLARAQQNLGIEDRADAYERGDQQGVDDAADSIRTASDHLDQILKGIERHEARTGRPVEPLEAFTQDRDRPDRGWER